MASGIRDKVAILGMGCSKFGERWDASPEDLMVEAYMEAMGDAGITPEQLDAAWFSTHILNILPLARDGVARGEDPLAGSVAALARSASTRSPIGRSCMRATPLSSNSPPWVAASTASAAVNGRMAVPALPRKRLARRTARRSA